MIRITSLLDGAVQHLTPVTLAQWQYTSAYFNGDSVLVELFDQAGHAPQYSVDVTELIVGRPTPASRSDKSLCGPDSRQLSTFKKSGRFIGSGGCTGWLIDDSQGCFLTVHHCGTDSTGRGVMEFEVPPFPGDSHWARDRSPPSRAPGLLSISPFLVLLFPLIAPFLFFFFLGTVFHGSHLPSSCQRLCWNWQ